MANINLLPEDLRDKESKAREQAQSDPVSLGFSKPQEKAEAPAEGEVPGRWQQLMSALKKNISTPTTPVARPPVTPRHTPPTAAPVEPPVVSVGSTAPMDKQPVPPVKATPITKTLTPPEPKPSSRAQVMATGPKAPGQPPTILDVNLIPAQEGKPISRRQVALLTSSVIVAIVLVLGVYMGLRFYVSQKESENEAIEQEVISLQQQLESARAEAEAALAMQSRIAILGEQLNERSHWQEFFKFLENNTIPTVVLNNLAADENGSVSLSGQAPSMTEVGRQMLAFEQHPQVITVTLGDVGFETSRDRAGSLASYVRFNLSLKVEPRLFTIQGESQ